MKHIHKTNDAIYITSDEQPYIVEVCENKIEEIKMKQETLEEAIKRLYGEFYETTTREQRIMRTCKLESFRAGFKWQQERSYSEDDLEEAFKSGFTNCYNNDNLTFGEWFEQFKKK
jgi:hypothetical protein